MSDLNRMFWIFSSVDLLYFGAGGSSIIKCTFWYFVVSIFIVDNVDAACCMNYGKLTS